MQQDIVSQSTPARQLESGDEDVSNHIITRDKQRASTNSPPPIAATSITEPKKKSKKRIRKRGLGIPKPPKFDSPAENQAFCIELEAQMMHQRHVLNKIRLDIATNNVISTLSPKEMSEDCAQGLELTHSRVATQLDRMKDLYEELSRPLVVTQTAPSLSAMDRHIDVIKNVWVDVPKMNYASNSKFIRRRV